MLDSMMMGGQSAPPAPEPEMGDPLDEVVSLLRQAFELDGQLDADENLLFEQVTTLIAKFRSKRSKEEQAALGGGPATNFLKRSGG